MRILHNSRVEIVLCACLFLSAAFGCSSTYVPEHETDTTLQTSVGMGANSLWYHKSEQGFSAFCLSDHPGGLKAGVLDKGSLQMIPYLARTEASLENNQLHIRRDLPHHLTLKHSWSCSEEVDTEPVFVCDVLRDNPQKLAQSLTTCEEHFAVCVSDSIWETGCERQYDTCTNAAMHTWKAESIPSQEIYRHLDGYNRDCTTPLHIEGGWELNVSVGEPRKTKTFLIGFDTGQQTYSERQGCLKELTRSEYSNGTLQFTENVRIAEDNPYHLQVRGIQTNKEGQERFLFLSIPLTPEGLPTTNTTLSVQINTLRDGAWQRPTEAIAKLTQHQSFSCKSPLPES